MFSDRKSSYKLPPTTIRDKLVSQEARRSKALEEQKRRRAQRVDSTRQLDLFAGLTLGASDDDDADPDQLAAATHTINEDDLAEGEEEEQQPRITPASVAQYAAMLMPGYVGHAYDSSTATPSTSTTLSHSSFPTIHNLEIGPPAFSAMSEPEPMPADTSATGKPKKKNKRGGGQKRRAQTTKPSKWADKCMYAELLEMRDDEPWNLGGNGVEGSDIQAYGDGDDDGLPRDLESGWVAVAPVPVGKRCLAVTHQSAGVAGVVPNTTLRSRLLGKSLLARFPSALPPLTVLDCILDANWRENGILHVLDVVRWKGQDVADCEAGFRFWWRDTRLAELPSSHPPISLSSSFHPSASSQPTSPTVPEKYTFPYPTTFLPVPYHTNTTLLSLDGEVIPAARAWREVSITVPSPLAIGGGLGGAGIGGNPNGSSSSSGDSMAMEAPGPHLQHPSFSFAFPSIKAALPASPAMVAPLPLLQIVSARVRPDGMLLYVAEASFEPGTSPLSSWVPICGYGDGGDVKTHKLAGNGNGNGNGLASVEGPLDLFQRLVKRRMARLLLSGSGSELRGGVGEVMMEEEDVDMAMG